MKKTSIFSLLLMVSSVFAMDVEKALVRTGVINFLDQSSAAREILTKVVLQNTLNQELLEACTGNNSVEAMKKLIEQGADPLCHDDFGMTSLMSQAGNDNPEAVNYLLQVVQDRKKEEENFFRRDTNGNTALMFSVMCGCEQSLRVLQKYHHMLFGKKLDNRHRDNHRNTPLMLAASMPWENIAILELLRDSIDDINEINSDGDTALHCAVKRGNFRIVQHLIEHGAKVDIRNNKMHTVLEEAIIHNHDEILKFLMKDLPNGGRPIDDLLRIAVQNKHFNACYYLVEEKGASLLSRDNYGRTVLMYAAESGDVDFVRYLVDGKGANILDIDNHGNTILMYAAKSGNVDLVRDLVERKEANLLDINDVDETVLMYAAKSGNVDLVRYLVERKEANILDRNEFEETVLMHAAKSGNVDLVRYLVEEKGANCFDKDSLYKTVVMHAAESGNLELVRYLVEVQGANLLHRDDVKATVLMYAAESGNVDLVRYLVEEKEAILLDKDNFGNTVLMHAAKSGNVDLVRYLVEEKGLDIGYYVGILLVKAIQSGNVDLVRYLVEEKGANPLDKNNFGMTVVMYAAHSGNVNLVRYLVEEKGANLLDKDNRNKTVLIYAAESRNIDLVRYLEGKIQPKA